MSGKFGGAPKCTVCGKSVYAAELQRWEDQIFHQMCFHKWSKEKEAAENAKRNAAYHGNADVKPAYYRVGDPESGKNARLETGDQYRQGK
eukprot:TRINITY_DN7750_c0_g1_i1.p1 TRINITY_DN7750_c0_g1~~TRINITY_DN7750_c0_g1_i1.p1  ORF type:complete len:102 (+),score=20.20 TRINITY_DN7750_c0_g1_i1:39-308(+)